MTTTTAPKAGKRGDVEPAAVRAQLERVLASPGFARSPRMTAMLRYVVERTLNGEAAYLKEYSIALEVFEREDDFDPQTNPVVRVQASKLRRLLSLYFLEEGRDDPVVIELPRGSYVPAWHERGKAGSDGESMPASPADAVASAPPAPAPEVVEAQSTLPSVAVLLFTMLGVEERKSEYEALSLGLLEEVVTGLSSTEGVEVVAHRQGRQDADVREIGRKLGVRCVLEGTVRAAGATARVGASLVETQRGLNLWSDRFDASLDDTSSFELQEALGREVVQGVCEALGLSGVTDSASPPLTSLGPERRQITVMQCQLADAAAINAKLDPEDAFTTVRAAQQRIAEAVNRYSGHVARQSGDGVVAYFGYPQAHEDDAERSLRAGLDALQAIRSLESAFGQQLLARAGIATGPVVIGAVGDEDATGGAMQDASGETSVIGATLGIAEQLQANAQGGEILASPRTCRLAGKGFDYEGLPGRAMPDVDQTLTPRRVLGLARSGLRFEPEHSDALGPIVGRDEELGLLLRRWRSAQAREGQVVVIGGEPGIGKSRLVWGLGDAIAEDTHWRLRYQCSPYHSGTALHPVAERIQSAAQIDAEDDNASRLTKLEQVLGESGRPLSVDLPPIAALVGIEPEERYTAPGGSPERQRELLLDALEAQAVARARRRPTLLIFEDAHWADPTSLELFERVVERALSERLLIVVTHRPELRLSWEGYPHITTLQLSRIGREAARAIVERHSEGRSLTAELTRQILDKTDGVPLFVEELTRTVVETRAASEVETGAAPGAPLAPLAIPDTLQDSLMARLDRLPAVKRVAQVAAAVGREFSYGAVEAVADVKPEILDDALQRLVDSGLVFRRGQPPRAKYQFKHALVQDAAYSTLLRAQRRELHAHISNVLEEGFPELVEATQELLAH
ncbi:MAG: AAA family ATPase, partial [Gammaproteobacteria bacterium]